MDILTTEVSVVSKLSVAQILEGLREFDNAQMIMFLGQLDEAMGSWDFTQQAAELFAAQMRRLHRPETSGLADESWDSVKELEEFLRQLTINPQVKIDPNFYTVWTDPQAQPAQLNIHALETVRDLATLALNKLDES